jgi:predicted ATPase/DNA-binding CsgD family transcriptional regulator
MSRSVSPESWREGSPEILPVALEPHSEPRAFPRPRTSFVGREHEIERVQALLRRSDVRLITLTGPGGVGKTRTALEAVSSAHLAAHFVDLADVQQPALVLPTVAAALGVRPDGRSVLDILKVMLRDGEYLLVLDNFEQVLPAASAVADLLDLCPGVKLLVTSRATLGIAGEHLVDIRPFPVPPVDAPAARTPAVDFDACRLFVDRAQALDQDFSLTPADAESIASICRRLEGLPLAIELAAAWVSVLSPGAVLAQLDHRLALSHGGSRNAPPRQRSLRDTITWSYGLLSPAAQTLFRRLAVFNGGWSLEAMTEICGDGSLNVLQELRALIANSLVRRTDDPAGDSRYTMLETVREFSVELLQLSDEASLLSQRHAEYFLALAERAEAKQDTLERDVWLNRLEADRGNLHSALAWALEQEDAEIAVGLCGSLLPLWQFRYYANLGREWARRALALALDKAVPAPAMRKALFSAGTLAYVAGDRDEAAVLLADALQRYREADDPRMTGRVELALGRLTWADDEPDLAREGRAWFVAARRSFERCGDRVGLAFCLHYEGLVAFDEGEFARAKTALHESWAMWQALGFTWELAQCIPGHLADVARIEGNRTDAMTLYQECLKFNWERQYLEDVTWSLAGLALIAATDGQVEQAVRLAALADRFEWAPRSSLTPHIRRLLGAALGMIGERVDAERFAQIRALVKSADPAVEIQAALALTRGETPPGTPAPAPFGLTAREHDVLRKMAAGKSNHDIAEELSLSVGTVKIHVTRILAKLDVKSRAAATDIAHRHHLA